MADSRSLLQYCASANVENLLQETYFRRSPAIHLLIEQLPHAKQTVCPPVRLGTTHAPPALETLDVSIRVFGAHAHSGGIGRTYYIQTQIRGICATFGQPVGTVLHS